MRRFDFARTNEKTNHTLRTPYAKLHTTPYLCSMNITQQQILDALKNVDDPDLKKDIVTLGMVKDIVIDGKNISFSVVLTTPACPMKELIHRACVKAILDYVDKDANVKVNMTANV